MLPRNGFTKSTVASSPCLQRRYLGNERGAGRLGTGRSSTSRGSKQHGTNTASPTRGAVWRHRSMLRRNPYQRWHSNAAAQPLPRNPTMSWHVTICSFWAMVGSSSSLLTYLRRNWSFRLLERIEDNKAEFKQTESRTQRKTKTRITGRTWLISL
jgi:hypothetical protein